MHPIPHVKPGLAPRSHDPRRGPHEPSVDSGFRETRVEVSGAARGVQGVRDGAPGCVRAGAEVEDSVVVRVGFGGGFAGWFVGFGGWGVAGVFVGFGARCC